MDMIKSKDNNKIKYAKNLKLKKFRDQENAFLAEGIKFVAEAALWADIKFLLLTEGAYNKEEVKDIANLIEGQKVFLCSDQVLESVADTVSSQGLIAVVNKKTLSLNNIIEKYNFIIMCDRIQDPGNLGTIVRIADAFGPAALLLNKGCVDLFSPKVVRASAGAVFRVPAIHTDEASIDLMKENKFYIVSTVVDSEYTFDDMDEKDKICLVVGNEGQGISRDIIDASDIILTIRMTGRAESLNASVAAGISIYEIRKKLLK